MSEIVDLVEDAISEACDYALPLFLLERCARAAINITTQEWQPVETAPKDTRVLVCQMTDGDYERQITCGWLETGSPSEYWFCDIVGLWPTHWMPLPSHPR